MRPVPCGLAGWTACAVGGQGATGEAGLAYWHEAQVNGALQVGQVGCVMGAVSSGVGCSGYCSSDISVSSSSSSKSVPSNPSSVSASCFSSSISSGSS